jgi:hypothetical protein
MVQHMIDILGTNSNYEESLTRVVAGNAEGPRSSLSRICPNCLDHRPPLPSIFDQPSELTLTGYKLDQMDDTAFLTEICTIITKKPAYRQVVEEILREATKSLGIKLEKLKQELINLVRNHVARIVKQEIDERINAEKRDADQAANARLRSLIRASLDAEADHPTNR